MERRFFIAIVVASLLKPAHAAFEDLGVGARAPGMANAFVAVADDAGAMYYNPAGLTQINATEITTQYGQLLSGLSDASTVAESYVGGVQPLKAGQWGVVGASYENFRAANYFMDRMLALSYGWSFKPRIFGWNGRWSSGVAVRQFHRQYEPDLYTGNAVDDSGVGSGRADPLFAAHGFSKDAYAMDLGELYRFGDRNNYSAGVAFQNITQTDTALGGGEKSPAATRLGLAWRPTWGVLSAELQHTQRLSSAVDNDMAFGAERTWSLKQIGSVSLRGGFGQGSRGFETATAGFSLYLSNAAFDYSFVFPLGNMADTKGDQRIALSFHLNSSPAAQKTAPHQIISSVTTKDQALRHYADRKSQGAPVEERLSLLQEFYRLYGPEGIDLAWFSKELSSL